MKVVLCSSEVVPFAKTGGLADVAGALPFALEKKGVEVIVVMPKYKMIQDEKFKIKKTTVSGVSTTTIGDGIKVYFIENKKYFDRDGLYGDKYGDFGDNLERFMFYCKATLDLLKKIDFKADAIHCNDWQSALIPIYLKTVYKNNPFYRKMRTVFTIHNIGYQGLFAKEEFPKLGLPEDAFGMEGLEFYGKINFLKGGLLFSDAITTVSPTYSREIQTKEFGAGLDGVLSKRRDSLYGIINGLDYDLWDPAKDSLIFKKFSPTNLENKYANKLELQKKYKLKTDESVPLFGFVGRLAEQKGVDIMVDAIEKIAATDAQTIILGTGEIKYHQILEGIAKKFPKTVSLTLGFDNAVAHQIYAGSDIFLMPSRYEPCGLGQMISMKYGSIPIAFKTGGLADTIIDFDPAANKGTGFLFDGYHAGFLLKIMKLAAYFYTDKKLWKGLMTRAFKANFSWDDSAKQYIALYK